MRTAQITLAPNGDLVLADNDGHLILAPTPASMTQLVEWLRGSRIVRVDMPPSHSMADASNVVPTWAAPRIPAVEDLF